jgi:glycosyltransferase involved in cell wall biosynthesis
MSARPLATFAIIAYNQEEYIHDAVIAAFSQDYTPLEIILSDDCSTDSTYAILEKMAEKYKGPHRIKLIKNNFNAGICGHINRVWEESEGEWFFIAAGDDVSASNRVSRVMDIVTRTPNIKLVQTFLNLIDRSGENRGIQKFSQEKEEDKESAEVSPWQIYDRLLGQAPRTHGACFCYSAELYKFFGPLPEGGIYEDNILNWRAELLGNAVLLREPLVSYRSHENQVTQSGSSKNLEYFDNRRVLNLADALLTTKANFEDFQKIKRISLHSKNTAKLIENNLRKRKKYFAARLNSVTRNWPCRILDLVYILIYNRNYDVLRGDNLLRSLLPNSVYFFLKSRGVSRRPKG